VLLVRVKDMLFALPMVSIAESLKVKEKEVSTIEGRMAIQVRGHTMPVIRLDEVLALPRASLEEAETTSYPLGAGKRETAKEGLYVVIATSLEKRVGLIIDKIVGEEEVFIKSLGEHLGRVKNVSGATILGTGEVVVILDVADLIANSALSHPAVASRKAAHKDQKKGKRILIVEDALSTRELEKSILETQGYIVDTAVDGLDGLDKVSQTKYDLFVVDIQMPRMDGFEFCKTVKKSEEHKDIPVVIVTALEKEEDKRRGIEVGAQAYIVKTSFDQSNLLDTIERLTG
ncbi:MAG: response regulator, partial [Candidatus Omnitrophota bacterium]|nr:response regulator [Candidatus Omnitrophota bacterium]